MDKTLNLVYFSATGTTKKIIKSVAKGIGSTVKEYDLTLPQHRQNKIEFNSDDLVIVGVPVYAGRVPQFLAEYFAEIKGKHTKAVFIVVYGNRDYDDALLELKDIFEKNGFSGIAAAAFIGEHSYTSQVGSGRPDVNDISKASAFGTEIKNILSGNSTDTQPLTVKGLSPYKERIARPAISPKTNDNCTGCSICASNCPMGIISFTNFIEIDTDKCIKCCSCIKKCPANAKYFDDPFINNIKEVLIKNCSGIRREPDIFIS